MTYDRQTYKDGVIKTVSQIEGEEMTEIEKSLRHRVNVTTSVKGVKTWDCTVDGTGYTQEQVLEASDRLVAQLEQRYPVKVE